jgi:hypothetical protein
MKHGPLKTDPWSRRRDAYCHRKQQWEWFLPLVSGTTIAYGIYERNHDMLDVEQTKQAAVLEYELWTRIAIKSPKSWAAMTRSRPNKET